MNETELFLSEFGEIPELESGKNVSTKEILDRIKEYLNSDGDEVMNYHFLELLSMYPDSFLMRDMSETLKRVITAYYIWNFQKPLQEYNRALAEWERDKYSRKKPVLSDHKPYYSYDRLAVLFGRSKSSIHEAISQFKDEYERLYFKRKDEYAEFLEWKKTQRIKE
jgi:hypothetical protein